MLFYSETEQDSWLWIRLKEAYVIQ